MALVLAGCGGGGGNGTPPPPPAPTLAELSANWVAPPVVTPTAVTGDVQGMSIHDDGFVLLSETLPSLPGDPVSTVRSRNYFGFIEVVDGVTSGTLNYVTSQSTGGPDLGVVAVSGMATDVNNLSALLEFDDMTTLGFTLVRGEHLAPAVAETRLPGLWDGNLFLSTDFPLALNFDAAGVGTGLFDTVCGVEARLTPILSNASESQSTGLFVINQVVMDIDQQACPQYPDYYGIAFVVEIGFNGIEILVFNLGTTTDTNSVAIGRQL